MPFEVAPFLALSCLKTPRMPPLHGTGQPSATQGLASSAFYFFFG